ncbi:GDSL esterase/lipase At4g10955-like [Aristolochia californica]|uniref:GDSL esterase/lipase At4g10955-like n=1 Tax=Aristolochia californica TaxID=171875 RepID=UPI0035DAC069
MTSERDVFSLCGPVHLTLIDWRNPDHRRSVAASLVQGVNVLERDRQQNRVEHTALSPPWWESFHFQIIRKLIDDADFSVFGAIYELEPTERNKISPEAPRFVIAFRGTITKPDSFSQDLKLDLHFIQNGLHLTSRFESALQAVQNMVSAVGHANVWLTGHSLGSAMAMLAGKNVVKQGMHLETFLFNPPFFSAPIERIKDKKLKHGIRVASSVITAGLAIAVKSTRPRPRSEDHFGMLSAWMPSLYVNPEDHICSEYVGYFEHRKKMEELGVGGIERLATQNSIGDLFLTALGRESEPLHLIPSANRTLNLSPSPDFKNAHGIHQWWSSDMNLKCEQYRYS